MDPDLLHTPQILMLLRCLHLSKTELNVANAFCTLERQYASAYGDCQRTHSDGIGKL